MTDKEIINTINTTFEAVVLGQLRKDVGSIAYRTWLLPTKLMISERDGIYILEIIHTSVEKEEVQGYFNAKYMPMLKGMLDEALVKTGINYVFKEEANMSTYKKDDVDFMKLRMAVQSNPEFAAQLVLLRKECGLSPSGRITALECIEGQELEKEEKESLLIDIQQSLCDMLKTHLFIIEDYELENAFETLREIKAKIQG